MVSQKFGRPRIHIQIGAETAELSHWPVAVARYMEIAFGDYRPYRHSFASFGPS